MRQPRTKRHRGLVVQLTDRDRLVLETLARFRLARTTDLLLTCFRGIHPTTAQMRLRRLFDAGHVQIHVAEIGSENVYRCKARIPRGSIAHHLAVVRVWAQLSNAPPGIELELCRADWELREELRHPEIVPDLFAVLAGRAFAIEVDRGTEPQSVIRKKLSAYASLPTLFGYTFKPLFVPEGADPWPLLRPLLPQQESSAPHPPAV